MPQPRRSRSARLRLRNRKLSGRSNRSSRKACVRRSKCDAREAGYQTGGPVPRPVVAPNPELPLAEQEKTLRLALREKSAGYRAEGNSFGSTTLSMPFDARAIACGARHLSSTVNGSRVRRKFFAHLPGHSPRLAGATACLRCDLRNLPPAILTFSLEAWQIFTNPS